MGETQNNVRMLHRKEWQTMMPALNASAAGTFVINDNLNTHRFSLYVVSATVHFLYDHENDDWIPIASGAFGTAIAAGACGTFNDWSASITATGGSTTTITVNVAAFNINGFAVGKIVEFLSGTAANIGLRRTITAIKHPGNNTGTITLTLDSAVSGAVANNDTFKIASGTFFVLMPGTLGATSFRKYDIALGTWTSCTQTGLPATWGTDGRMVTPAMLGTSYDSGTANADSSTTALECDGKGWAADQWINYQVRITAGTGRGQVRIITDNDADTLTIAAGVDLDDTSEFVIEGDENSIYLLGNNAITMYKYSISANSWATIAPTTLRAGAAVAGMSADFVGKTGNSTWADITDIKDGRYIYSFRGATAVLDRFDIAGGTNGAGAWAVITYHPVLATFAAGAGSEWDKTKIYVAKEGSATVPQRIYAFDVVENSFNAITTDWYLGGAAVIGNKIWIENLSSEAVVKWLYVLQSTSTTLRRIMIF